MLNANLSLSLRRTIARTRKAIKRRRPARTVVHVLTIVSMLLSMVLGAVAAPAGTAAAQAPPTCAAPANEIMAENCMPGTPPSEWDLGSVDSSAIEGFTTEMSVDQGQTVRFKVKTPSTDYRLDVYRIGYYGGLGARKVATVQPSATLPQSQPSCLNDASTGLIDCGNWAESASWAVPATAVSGVYLAKLVREDGTVGANHIPFIVRDDDGGSNVLFQTSDTTWQAYNSYGGNSLYVDHPPVNDGPGVGRAYKVSYNRPFVTRGPEQKSYLFNNEYPAIRFLERNGYDVSYSSGIDSDRHGAEIREHKAFLSVGHDEYWSGGQRANVEAAREAGVHLAFWSGNEVYWKTRWENAIDGSFTPYRTLVSYKETVANEPIDPSPTWTGTWRDPRFSAPYHPQSNPDGWRPENGLTGTIFTVLADERPMTVPDSFGALRFWRNTSIAGASGTTTLTPGILGLEWDEDLDNGARPAGLIKLSSTTATGVPKILGFGQGSTGPTGTATHSMTLYRHPTKNGAPSTTGALVFGGGTIQFAWGLDAVHDRGFGQPADANLQQAMINLLADMGVQPTTLMGGMTPAVASADTSAPTSAITSPTAGTVANTVTITGTASDAGGTVGTVEVSVDGGGTWHPATGTSSWSYTWYPQVSGPATIKSRAADDSGNVETPGAGVTVNVDHACPCTIWTPGTIPGTPAFQGDTNAVEVGMKFRTNTAGYISGVRFYKGPNNGGTHIGNLWSTTGTRLATGTFVNETAEGWQQVNFADPVAVTANTTYVASYFAPQGRYAFDGGYFSADVVAPPLRALANGVDGPNGVWLYASQSSYPNNDGNGSNYWVDPVFTGTPPGPDTTAPVISAVQATAVGGTSATITWTTDEPSTSQVEYGTTSTPVNPAMVTSHSVQLTGLTAGTIYSYRVKSADDGDNLAVSPTFSFTTAAPPSCPCTIWNGGAVNGGQFGPGGAIELGIKFRASSNGYVTGVRFYKAAGDGGTHVGSLWNNSTGELLASAEFAGESASGWQEVAFAAPVPVTAGTTYVASYHSPQGRYVATNGYFASAVQTDFLRALADGEDGGQGVFRGGSGFPVDSFGSTNYWVDPVFSQTPPTPDTTAPVISGAQAVAVNSTSATITWTTDDASSSVVLYRAASDSTYLTTSAPALVRTHAVRLTGLVPGLTYQYRVQSTNAANLSSTAPDPAPPLSFTTHPVQPCVSCSLWNNDTTPEVPYLASPQPAATPIEVGVKFRTTVTGKVLGVRFYKGALNTGTHVGHLWTAGGQLLASVTFVGETSSGWQQALFSQYVDILPNTTYVVSYTSPARAYAYNLNYFNQPVDQPYRNGPIVALSSLESPNGVYGDGAGGFPSQSGNQTNYWVDLVFSDQVVAPQADGMPPRIIARSPAPDAVRTGLTAVAVTFSEPVLASSIVFTLKDPAGQTVAGAGTYSAEARTYTFTPNAPLTPGTQYTAQVVEAIDLEEDPQGLEFGHDAPWSFTTGACPCSLFGAAAPNPVSFVGTAGATELGLKFRSDVDGFIRSIRFYQGAGNAGPHLGSLWTLQSATTGTLVATTSGEVEPSGLPGWKSLNFTVPIPIQANQVYVASYSAPAGGYAYTYGYFANSRRDGPIEALANGGTDGGNGVYGNGGVFPFASSEATNYWVDVDFDFTASPPNVAPSNLTLTQSATAIAEGGSLTLDGSFADPNNGDTHVVTIAWGDGSTTTLDLPAGVLTFSATHPYADDNPTATPSDTVAISATVTEVAGGSATASTTLTVNNVAPSATIGVGQNPAIEGSEVNLTAAVVDPGTPDTFTYGWSVTKNGAAFASGTTSAYSFTPDDNGTYDVTLVVTDDDGGTDTETRSITVGNVAPTGTITGAPATSPEGTSITLGSTASDASSVDVAAGLGRSWSVTKNGAAYASGSGAGISFTPTDNGSYVATLTISDKEGATGTATATIDVTNVAPTAAISGEPAIGAEAVEIPLVGSATDAGTDDTFTFAWTVTKDGAAFASGTGSDYTFTPDDNGTYVASLVATDDDGAASAAFSVEIPVINIVPQANITGVPAQYSVGIGETVTLGSQITDGSAIDNAAGFTRAWTVLKDGAAFGSGTATTFSFSPDAAATYEVNLTGTDKDGGVSHPDTEFIIVKAWIPIVTINGVPVGESPEGTAIALTSAVADDLPGATRHYAWNVTKDGVFYTSKSGTSGGSANLSLNPNDNGEYVVTLTVTNSGRVGSTSATIQVGNVAPNAQITGAPASGLVGTAITLGSTVTDPSTVDTTTGFTRSWTVTRDGAAYTAGTGASINFTPTVAGLYQAALTATDKDGAVSQADTETISVANPLTVTINGAPTAAINEGTAVSLTSTVTGHSGTPTYAWSVTRNGVAYGASGAAASYAFTPNNNGTYTVKLVVTAGGVSNTATKSITVNNVAPSGLTTNVNYTAIDEADTVTLSGKFVDPGTGDTHTLVINWGDGSPLQTITVAAGARTYSVTHLYRDDNPTGSSSDPNTINVTVGDSDGAKVSGNKVISVTNLAPILGAITAPTAPTRVNNAIAVSAAFTDAGVADGHTARVEWGDGTASMGTVAFTNGAGTVNASHIYTRAGTFTVKITLTDDDTGSSVQSFQYVVVYDPDGGWVAGIGEVNSPKGAYVPDLNASGKAYFGFVSRYPYGGASVPVGVTLFELKLKRDDFEFFAYRYDWLVVSGNIAQYTGTGTINGSGNYGFLLTSSDGHSNGGNSPDRFRLKVWNRATGALVYDIQDADPALAGHQFGAPQDAAPTTPVSKGIIHIFE